MRKQSILILSLALAGVLSTSAMAATKFTSLAGKHSREDIKGACDKAGGQYGSTDGGYGCIKGKTQISCGNSGDCEVATGRKLPAHAPLRAVLTGGGANAQSVGQQGFHVGPAPGLNTVGLKSQGLSSGGTAGSGASLIAGGTKTGTSGTKR